MKYQNATKWPNQFTHGWTKQEDEILQLWKDPDITIDFLMRRLPNRTYRAIRHRLETLRIKKPKSTLKTKEEKNMKEMIDLEKFEGRILSTLRQEKRLVKIPPRQREFTGKKEESAVLLLSDLHLGKENYFVDEIGKAEMTYNTDIATKEANRLIESISDINNLLSRSYKIDDLYVFGLGDLIEGDIIVSGQRFFIEAGAGEQMLFATRLLTETIKELLKMFQRIHFTIIGGNHGRMTEKRGGMQPWYNNFDYLTGKMLQEVFRNEPRVEIKVPESWFFTEKIYDWKYFLHHGATVHSWLGFPYYGISRQGLARRSELEIDIECIGHFHQVFEIPMSSKSITLVNGCWIERDSYSWERYGKLTKAEQIYFGSSPKRARSWQFVINLHPREVSNNEGNERR